MSVMTKKHFEIIITNMRHTKPDIRAGVDYDRLKQWEIDIKQLAHALKLLNPSFNESWFIDDCNKENYENNSDSRGHT